MEENKNTARLFHVEIAQGIYLISDPEQGPTEDGKSLAPGDDCGRNLVQLRSGQNKHEVLRWLFQNFQKGVKCRVGHHVHLVHYIYALFN